MNADTSRKQKIARIIVCMGFVACSTTPVLQPMSYPSVEDIVYATLRINGRDPDGEVVTEKKRKQELLLIEKEGGTPCSSFGSQETRRCIGAIWSHYDREMKRLADKLR